MDAHKSIAQIARRQGRVKSRDVVAALGISRQAAAAHLRFLVNAGILEKFGSTRAASYSLKKTRKRPISPTIKMAKRLNGLQEDEVFEEIARRLDLSRHMSKNARAIAQYAFSEMLNNAIDHSLSETAEIEVSLANGSLSFSIRDRGIGAFENIRLGFALGSEHEAAEHLFKGKQTTMPSRHSGQGIFFTSRIADRFSLRSGRLEAIVDNQAEDWAMADRAKLKGTLVGFSIRQRSKKVLAQLFWKYANKEFEFDRNVVRVGLGGRQDLVSRSQARRLLAGLETFKRIELDFRKIDFIGQAFADEIFRVFARRHPDARIEIKNASRAVAFMIDRARSSNKYLK
jgi:anti-sigma regulatory factor (Ser/Thr protein kinase)